MHPSVSFENRIDRKMHLTPLPTTSLKYCVARLRELERHTDLEFPLLNAQHLQIALRAQHAQLFASKQGMCQEKKPLAQPVEGYWIAKLVALTAIEPSEHEQQLKMAKPTDERNYRQASV